MAKRPSSIKAPPKKTVVKRRSSTEVEFGKEPKDIDFNKHPLSKFIWALNYYNARFGSKVGNDFLEKTFKDISWKDVTATDKTPTIAWLIKLQNNGCTLLETDVNTIDNYINDLRVRYPKGKTVADKVVKELNKGPKIKDKTHIADFDDIVDKMYHDYNVVAHIDEAVKISKEMTKTQIDDIMKIVEVNSNEIDLFPKNKDIKSGYAFLDASKMRTVRKFWSTLKEKLEFTKSVKAVIRKPRAKKPVTVEKKLKTFKYHNTNKELNLVSIKPETILKSNIVWLFNVKTRFLIRMESKEGFDIKGASLMNGISSVCKKIRKPEEVQAFSKLTRVRMDKDYKAMKTTETESSYRVSSDMVILRAFKV